MKPSSLTLLRFSLLAFLGGFLLYLTWVLVGAGGNRAGPPAGGAAPPRPEARSRVERMDFLRSQGERPDLRVKAEDMVALEDGATVLNHADITIPSRRGGEVWRARGETAKLYEKPRRDVLEGDVVVTRSGGGTLRTAALRYDEESGVVQSDGQVRFERGGVSGTAGKLVHHLDDGRTELSGGVDAVLSGEGREGRFRAERVLHDEKRGLAQMRGGVDATMGAYRLEAGELDLRLDEGGGVTGGEARGEARIRPRGGEGRSLTGDRIRFEVNHGALQDLQAEGGARAELPSEEGAPIRVEGETIAIRLDERGEPRDLEATAGEGGPVRVLGLPGAEDATATARRLKAVLLPGGGVDRADLEGEVSIRRADLEGFGRKAVWRNGESLELTGAPGIHGGHGRAYGDKVFLRPDGETRVEGRVHSVLESAPEGEEEVPLFQDDAGPVYVSAASLEVPKGGGRIVYQGDPVQAKQGDSSILCRELRVFQRDRRVEAEGDVRSRVRLESGGGQARTEAPFDPSQLLEGRSETLTYRPGEVVYGGGAVLGQAGSRLEAQKITLSLGEQERRDVRYVTAEGEASASMGSRSARGDRLEYDVEARVMKAFGEGGPAWAEDRDKGVEGQGKTLTLNLDSGTLVVEADPHGRTSSTFRKRENAPSARGGSGDEGSLPDGPQDGGSGQDIPGTEGR